MKEVFSKGRKQGWILFLILCCVAFALPLQVSASKEKGILVSDETDAFEEIFENPRKQGLVFEITYPEDKMGFLLREPDGTFLKPYTERPGVSWEKTASGIRLTMEEAKKGSFYLRYPALYASDMKVVVKTLKPEMAVRDFKVEKASDGRLSYAFEFAAESSFWYGYQIYLCRKDVTDTEILLFEGEGYTNRMMSGKIAVSGISSGTYALKVHVDVKQREEQEFVEESEAFSYQTEEKVQPLDDYEVVVKPEEEVLIADWSKSESAIYDAVLVEMKTKEGTIYRQKFPRKQATSCEIYYVPEMDAEISLFNCLGVQKSAPVRRMINKAGGEVLTLPKSSISNEEVWTFSYCTNTPLRLTITGGEIEEYREVNGEGKEGIRITGEPFQAFVSFVDAQGVCWRYDRELRVDKEAPELSISEIYDGYETRLDRLSLKGTTEENASVTFNGEAILNDEGYFSVPFVLDEGANPYCIEVRDEAGNLTRLEGSVIRMGALEYMSREEANPVLHMMAEHPAAFIAGIAAIVVVLLFVLAFVFCRRWHKITEKTKQKLEEQERSEEEKEWLLASQKQKHVNMLANLILGVAVLSTVFFFICGMVAGYAGQISQRSTEDNALPDLISEVYHIRITVGEMNQAVRILFFAALALYLISILLKMLASLMRKRLDILPEDVIRREEKKAGKKEERKRRREEKALRKKEKKEKETKGQDGASGEQAENRLLEAAASLEGSVLAEKDKKTEEEIVEEIVEETAEETAEDKTEAFLEASKEGIEENMKESIEQSQETPLAAEEKEADENISLEVPYVVEGEAKEEERTEDEKL